MIAISLAIQLFYMISILFESSLGIGVTKRWKSGVVHQVGLLLLSWKWYLYTLLDQCWDWNPVTTWTSRSSSFCVDSRLWDQEPHRLAMAAHVWKFTFWKCIVEHILPAPPRHIMISPILINPSFWDLAKTWKRGLFPVWVPQSTQMWGTMVCAHKVINFKKLMVLIYASIFH